MNVGINITYTAIGVSFVMLSIIGWNTTNKVRADMAAIEKMIKLECLTSIESDSLDASQFDM